MSNESALKEQILKLKREKRYLEDQLSLITSSNVFEFSLLFKTSLKKPWLLPLLPFRIVWFILQMLRRYFIVFVLAPLRRIWYKKYPPKKVAFLCYSGQTGGGERVALGHLKKASQHYRTDAFYITKPGPISKDAANYAGKVVFNRRPEYQLAAYRALYITLCMPDIALIKKLNPDIKIAVVIHDHLSGWIDYFQGYSHTPLIDKFICISKLVRDKLLDAVPDLDPNKVEVLYNPYFFGNDDLQNVKQDDNKEMVFGYVGRISPEKNPVSLVRVFKKFTKDHPEVKLQIVGGIDESLGHLRKYRDLMIAEIGDNKNISYLGYSNDTSGFIKKLYGMVFSSFIEGISVAATEALSYGVPVLTSNVGAMGEIVNEGFNGYHYDIDEISVNPFDIRENYQFFTEADEKRFIEALEKFVKTKWDSKAIAKDAMDKFSENVAYENFYKIFNGMLTTN